MAGKIQDGGTYSRWRDIFKVEGNIQGEGKYTSCQEYLRWQGKRHGKMARKIQNGGEKAGWRGKWQRKIRNCSQPRIYEPDGPIKQSDEMARGFSVIIGQHVTVGADGDEELIKTHRGINGDFAAEIILNFALFDR